MSTQHTITRASVTVTADVEGKPEHTSGWSRQQPIVVVGARATFVWRDGAWELTSGLTVIGARVKKNGEPYDEALERSVYFSRPNDDDIPEWASDVLAALKPAFTPEFGAGTLA